MRPDIIVLMPDVHVPDHHGKAVAAFLNFLADIQPAKVLQLGDLVDFLSVARWTTGTLEEDGRKLQREIDTLRRFYQDMRDAYTGPYIRIRGNHEDRLASYLRTKAQGLANIKALNLPDLLGDAEFDVHEVRQPFEVAPGVRAIHGTKISKHAGASVLRELETVDYSIVSGHVHRQGLVYRRMGSVQRFGMECGHLADQGKAHYLGHGHIANWHLGFGVLYVNGRDVQPALVSMKDDGSFVFESRKFRA